MVTSILVVSFIIIEQNTIGETKENNKWHSTQEPRTPKQGQSEGFEFFSPYCPSIL